MAENNPPKRPPGEPKPLLEEDITPVLARLDAWYAAHLPPDRYAFNPPATDAELDAFEGLVGLSMPRAYRQLYRWHDGEDDDRWGHIYGLPLLPLHQAGEERIAEPLRHGKRRHGCGDAQQSADRHRSRGIRRFHGLSHDRTASTPEFSPEAMPERGRYQNRATITEPRPRR